MFVVNCADIIGTKFFNLPFPGAVELTGYMMSLLVPAAAALVFLQQQHIRIEVVTESMPQGVKDFLDRVIALIIFVLLSAIAWRMFIFGMKKHGYGEYSDELQFPYYYVSYRHVQSV